MYKIGTMTLSLLTYLAAAAVLLGASAHATAQFVVDEQGRQLHTIYLDEPLVEQVDASGQEPMRLASDPRNAEDWRGWHLATTRAVVAQLEAQYGIEAVGMTSHIMMTFSAYLSPAIIPQLSANAYVTEIVQVTEGDLEFSAGGGGVTATRVTPVPAVPRAYEPFELEIVTRREDPGTLIAVNVGSVITVEHQTDEALDSLSPAGLMVVTIPGLPAGNYSVHNKEFSSGGYDAGAYLYPDLPVGISIEEAAPTQPVHALYFPKIKRYFITASEEEKDQLRNESVPVDGGFNAWPADGPAPESAQPVCRFYSAEVNSHFYTAREKECALLREADHGWEYEGIAFQALVPAKGGACPPGTDPVWRLYNNRYAQQDSNHRFVASVGIYHSMVADGWIGEGVAFCSPPSSDQE